MSKFFLWSRGLWGAAIPLIVACVALAGVDTENLAEDLEKLGGAAALVIAGVLGLLSRFKPDNAKLKGKPGALVVCLIVGLAVGCATRVSMKNPFLTVVTGGCVYLRGQDGRQRGR